MLKQTEQGGKLDKLKGEHLYLVEVLVEDIEITRGPWKNSGDFDSNEELEEIWTPEAEESEEDEDKLEGDQLGTGVGDRGDGKVKKKTKGKRSSRSKGAKGRVSQSVCTNYPIDSWGPRIDSKSYLGGGPMKRTHRGPLKSKKNRGFKRPSSNKSASSSIKSKTTDTEPDLSDTPKPADEEGDDEGEEGVAAAQEVGGMVEAQEAVAAGPVAAGPVAAGPVAAGPVAAGPVVAGPVAVVRPPPARTQRVGPLPPLRVAVKVFHLQEMFVHQVDMDKLYPPPEPELTDSDQSTPQLTPKARAKKTARIVAPKKKGNVSKKGSNKTSGKSTPSKASKKSLKGSSSEGESDASSKENSKKFLKGQQHASSKSPSNKESKSSSKASIKDRSREQSREKVVREGELDVKELVEALKEVQADRGESSQPEMEECPPPSDHLIETPQEKEVRSEEEKSERKLKKKLERERREAERSKREETIKKLRRITEFRRGVSFVLPATPLQIISQVMKSGVQVRVERAGGQAPPIWVGTARVRLPRLCCEVVRAVALERVSGPLWVSRQDTLPIMTPGYGATGRARVYACLTCLGRAATAPSPLADCGLYSFVDVCHPVQRCQPKPAPTAFLVRRGCPTLARHPLFVEKACNPFN